MQSRAHTYATATLRTPSSARAPRTKYLRRIEAQPQIPDTALVPLQISEVLSPMMARTSA
jgi:hypothetical protein